MKKVWEALAHRRGVARNTVHTLMERLTRKGWLKRRMDGQVHYYSARSSRTRTMKNLVNRLHNLPPEDMHPALWNPRFSSFLVTGNVVTPLPNREGFEQTQYLGMNDDGCLIGKATTTTRDDPARPARIIASQAFLAIPRR